MTDLDALVAALRGAFQSALAGFSLRSLVAEALPPLPPKRALVRVVAAGKAALPMMLGALDRWPDRVERGLVVTTPRADEERTSLPEHVERMEAPHPIPDERSVVAAARALSLASGLDTPDLLLVLISGGASSLMAAPVEGFSLDEKQSMVRDLLESGAGIRDVNLVRRHVSRIKGGRLAAIAAPARVLTLAVSDVIGGELHDIGSGPSVPDPTTLDEARAALRRFAPAWEGRAPLRESLKREAAPRWRAQVIAGPSIFGEHVRDHLRAAGFPSARLLDPEEGDAETIALRRTDQARALSPGEALVIPCEPTVRLPPDHGAGGRAGWVALRALEGLPDDVALLCGATDGADASSRSGGALVTAATRRACPPERVQQALTRFDDAPLHEALGTLLPGRPTGLNFADVHVLARCK